MLRVRELLLRRLSGKLSAIPTISTPGSSAIRWCSNRIGADESTGIVVATQASANVPLSESGIGAPRGIQAPHEESCRNQQHHGDRDLASHQRLPQTALAPGRRRPTRHG